MSKTLQVPAKTHEDISLPKAARASEEEVLRQRFLAELLRRKNPPGGAISHEEEKAIPAPPHSQPKNNFPSAPREQNFPPPEEVALYGKQTPEFRKLVEKIKSVARFAEAHGVPKLNFYEWRYHWEPEGKLTSIGLMIEDVEPLIPHAIHQSPSGHGLLDYQAVLIWLLDELKKRGVELDSYIEPDGKVVKVVQEKLTPPELTRIKTIRLEKNSQTVKKLRSSFPDFALAEKPK